MSRLALAPFGSLLLPRCALLPEPERAWAPRIFHSPGYPCCCGNPCDICLNDQAPAQMEVVLSGFIAYSGVGELCTDGQCAANFDGTYILDFFTCTPTTDPYGPYHVMWKYAQGTATCTLESIVLLVFWDDDPSYPAAPKGTIRVNIIGGDTETYNFQLDGDDTNKVDCENLVDLDIPFVSQSSISCDASGATCAISSL